MRLCTSALLLSFLAIGCTDPADDTGRNDQGLTEIHIDARSMLAAGITRVTVESSGQSADLVLDQNTGTYDGAIVLPSGPRSLLAQAFVDATLVGASNPTEVNVVSGEVTRVMMRILDLTGSAPPLYGPILDSLVFPATAQAAASVTFTASVVAPAADPVTYAWSSSCLDSTFSSPASAVTSWSKATEGTCTITMLATSNGLSATQSFGIVVFPAGSSSGAIDVSASFVTTPSIVIDLPQQGCFVLPGSNSSCPGSIASPTVTSFSVNVASWGGSTPGGLTLSDSCGGRIGTERSFPGSWSGYWLPPVGAGVCILTANASNSDGLVATLPAAILVRAGTPPTAQPPSISGQVLLPRFCPFSSATPEDCGTVPAGTQVNLSGFASWADGHPGSVTLLDNCGGSLVQPSDAFNFSSPWVLPNLPGGTCTLTVRATSLEGSTSEASVVVHLL